MNKINEWELIQGEVHYFKPSTRKFLNKHKNEIIDMLDSDKSITDIANKLKINRTSLLKTYIYGDKKLLHHYNLYKHRKAKESENRIDNLMNRSSRNYFDKDVGDFSDEKWKNILGYEGYQVSNYGRVRRFAKRYNNYYLIQPCKNNKTNREYVALISDGKQKNMNLSRIVAHTFVNGYNEHNNTVDHIDGDVTNNKASNLRWVSQSVNNAIAYKNGKNPNIAYSKNGRFKKIVLDDKYEFKTIVALAKFLNLSETQVSRQISGEAGTNHIFKFIY